MAVIETRIGLAFGPNWLTDDPRNLLAVAWIRDARGWTLASTPEEKDAARACLDAWLTEHPELEVIQRGAAGFSATVRPPWSPEALARHQGLCERVAALRREIADAEAEREALVHATHGALREAYPWVAREG